MQVLIKEKLKKKSFQKKKKVKGFKGKHWKMAFIFKLSRVKDVQWTSGKIDLRDDDCCERTTYQPLCLFA